MSRWDEVVATSLILRTQRKRPFQFNERPRTSW
jgi:hypothetical protein